MIKNRYRMKASRVLAASVATLGAGALLGLSTVTASGSPSPQRSATNTSWGAGWSAWDVVGSNAYMVSAGATFVVPTLNCAGNTGQLGESFGVEEGSFGPFTGNPQAIVQEECNQTTPSYQFIVLVGATKFVEGGVGPGDTVVASFFQASNFAQATVHDLSSGYTWVAQGAPPNPGAAADIGEFDVIPSSAPLAPAPFGSVTFTKVQVNGDYLGFSNTLGQWNLKQGSVVNITTGAIAAGHDSFKQTFRHS